MSKDIAEALDRWVAKSTYVTSQMAAGSFIMKQDCDELAQYRDELHKLIVKRE